MSLPYRGRTGLLHAAMPKKRPSVHTTLGGAFALLLGIHGTTFAQSQFEQDFDDRDKPWQEVAVQLPQAPEAENLLPFYVSATATQAFAVDAESLSVGTDGVVRYTLVATSNAGARNVSYEGIRCSSYEKKSYAFGRPDGSWSRSRRDSWQPIEGNAANRQHAALASGYFCQESTVAGKATDIAFRLRNNQSLAPNTGR